MSCSTGVVTDSYGGTGDSSEEEGFEGEENEQDNFEGWVSALPHTEERRLECSSILEDRF